MKNLIQKCVICFLVSIAGYYIQAQEIIKNEVLSPEVIALQQRQSEARKNGNIDEVLKLQYELDRLTGSVTKSGENVSEVPPLLNTESFLDSIVCNLDNVSGIASTSEQRGANSGRIWNVSVGGSTSTSISDTAYIHYSNDGRTWTLRSKFSLSPNEYLNKNEVDCEIIEDHTGDKYLYTVYGINNSAIFGRKQIKYSVTRITGTASTITGYLSWPGDVVTNNYYRPRITSDNATYSFGARLYISASLDSLVTTTHRALTKIAQVLNPYTMSPSFTYKSSALLFFYSTGTRIPDTYSDLAYYNDGGTESVMFTESNMSSDTSGINVYKSSVANFTGAKTFVTSLRPDSKKRDAASICSYGLTANLFVVCREITSSTNKKTQYFRSTNAGANWTNGYTEATGWEIAGIPDVSCRRNFNEFYVSSNFSNLSESNNKTLLSIFKGSQVNRNITQNSEVHISSGAGYTGFTPDKYYCIWAGEKTASSKGKWVNSTYPVADASVYSLSAENFAYLNPNELHFDINIKRMTSGYMELAYIVLTLTFNTAFLNGGTGSIEDVISYGQYLTDLNISFFPMPKLISGNKILLQTRLVGDNVNQDISDFGQGSRIIRVKLKTTAPAFADVPLSLSWNNVDPNKTRVLTFVENTLTEITNGVNHSVNYTFNNFYSGLDIPDLFFTKGGSEDFYGNAVSDAGDVNGDGYDDFITAGYQIDIPYLQSGRVFVHYGGPFPDNIPDVTIDGLDFLNHMGSSVSKAGDVNNDGFDDIIVSNDYWANSQAFIYFGGNPMNNTPDVILNPFNTSTFEFEGSVSNAGDVNRDGFDDVIVGEALNSNMGINSGRALIYFGGNPMNDVPDITLSGETAGDFFGCSVSSAGDVNKDGYADVIVGAYGHTSSKGRAYIYYGGGSMNNVADVILNGSAVGNRFGFSVSDAGDVNGDNYSDVIVGSPRFSDGGTNRGKAEIFFGGDLMNNHADVVINGVFSGEFFGTSVSNAGNVNSDNFSDVIIGAPWSIFNGNPRSGVARVFHGGAAMDPFADLILPGNPFSKFGFSVSSAGDINKDGSDDLIVGAPDYQSQSGNAFVYFSPSYPGTINLSLSALIQGFYNPVLNTMTADTVRVYLRNAIFPYVIKDSAKSVLNSSGSTNLVFNNAGSGNYFVVLKHRNSIETWSSAPGAFIRGGTNTYNFFNSSSSAYGINQIQVDTSPIRYAIYGGDIDQDGSVGAADLISVNNAAATFTSGYAKTDITGDNIVDVIDVLLTFNNSGGFVVVIKP